MESDIINPYQGRGLWNLPMEKEIIAGISLFFDQAELETTQLIRTACERSTDVLCHHWGLSAPSDCRVYVMTSWPRFLFHSAPWPWKIYLASTFPLIAWRARMTWAFAGGWSLSYGRRRVAGIKPYRLIALANRSLGDRIYLPQENPDERVQAFTCHELTHVFTFHLKLPAWLNEGLATLAMEYYLDRRIVRGETLEQLAHLPQGKGAERLRVDKPEALIAQYLRGYWLTRCIDETRQGLLKELLSKRHGQRALAEKVASAFGKTSGSFWKEIDKELIFYFRGPNPENVGRSITRELEE